MTNSKLREALQFYADKDNYVAHVSAFGIQQDRIMVDGGHRAREALSASDEGTPTETPP